MAEKLTVFDPAERLGKEDFQTYLKDAFESGDPAEMLLALGDVARARNMSELARQTGITRVGIAKALAGGNPTLDTISKLAGALGYKITIQPVLSTPDEPNAGSGEAAEDVAGHARDLRGKRETSDRGRVIVSWATTRRRGSAIPLD